MSKMGWLHYLVENASRTEDDTELLKHLIGLGFKNPKIASREFTKAYKENEELLAKHKKETNQ